MTTDTPESYNKDRRILVAVDDSENAERAVLYVPISWEVRPDFVSLYLPSYPNLPQTILRRTTRGSSGPKKEKLRQLACSTNAACCLSSRGSPKIRWKLLRT